MRGNRTHCTHCYRARNFIKSSMGRLFSRPAPYTEYRTAKGSMVRVDNETHKLVDTNATSLLGFIGVEVYAAKGKLINLETGRVLMLYAHRKRVHLVGTIPTTGN